ncbi:MAG: hypothetical protein QGH39_04210, partial [Candidatus Thermoplasmatota archaeon]|nr:hypothetical protein [Candidatus Thermoplasmatota archaeon]
MLHGTRCFHIIGIMLATAVMLLFLFPCMFSTASTDVDKFTTGTPPQTITFTEPNNLINSEHGVTLLSKSDVEEFDLVIEGKENNGSYPSGLSLDILGGGGSPDWNYIGELKGEVAIYGSNGDPLVTALTEAKRNYRNVIFEFSSVTSGILVLKSLAINFNKQTVKTPPIISSVSPENGTIHISKTDPITFSVNVSKSENMELSYEWFLSGKNVAFDKMYIFEPKSEGVETLVVKVSDGVEYVSYGWTILVEFENLVPVANITSPEPNGKEVQYSSGIPIPFSAAGSSDPDGNLTHFSWISSIDGEISNSANDKLTLSPGNHDITLRVIDNQGSVSTDLVNIKVDGSLRDDAEEPDLGWILFFIFLGLFVVTMGILIIIIARKTHRNVHLTVEKEEDRVIAKRTDNEGSLLDDKRDKRKSKISDRGANREIKIDDSVKCEVCNKSFTSFDSAYRCRCDSLFHPNCIISDCPSCGRDTGSSLESVNIRRRRNKRNLGRSRPRKAQRGRTNWLNVDSGAEGNPVEEVEGRQTRKEHGENSSKSLNDISMVRVEWVEISSIPKSNICIQCRKMLKKGSDSNKCPNCGKLLH